MKPVCFPALVAVMISMCGPARLVAADWPQWRFDAGRTADSPERLSPNLRLAWTREYAPRVPAWEDPLNQDLMGFDAIFEPIVVSEHLLVGFNDRDKLVALDIRTGREAWTFYTDGPVRLAPTAWKDKVFVAADDGHLYCVRADTGALVWKFHGAPSQRKALGNGRLVSAWPARGGPVVYEGTVYFASSIWPFMGTFIYALDAETGRIVWVNDGTGAQYMKQPHSAPAFAGVAPQGSLVATEKYLLVPGGRSVPAAFDRRSGEFLYYHLTESGKGTGGAVVMATDSEFFVHTRLRGTRAHELKNGKRISFTINEPVLGSSHYYTASIYGTNHMALAEAHEKLASARYSLIKAESDLDDALEAGESAGIKKASNTWSKARAKLRQCESDYSRREQRIPSDGLRPVIQSWRQDKKVQWELPADGTGDLIRAGGLLFGAGSNALVAVQVPKAKSQPAIVWSHPVEGQVRRLLAAHGMLFAVTLEGRILAFGSGGGSPPVLKEFFPPAVPSAQATQRARTLLEQTGAQDGYALCLGLEDGDLLAALATLSKLHIVGVDSDAQKVDRLRRQLDAAGLYGTRIALLAAEPEDFGAPPYMANLVIVSGAVAPRLADGAVVRKIFESVRPYGGAMWIDAPTASAAALAGQVQKAQLARARVTTLGQSVVVTREGALPGAADWTHQYGDVANTVKSDDQAVKLPVGVLWFGGNTHMDVLPRHGHGPSEQVAGGRLFIEGMDCISARDVYTGRRLWKTVIPGLDTFGVYHDATFTNDPLTTLYNQKHIPGANARGANYVVTADRVYVAVSNDCVMLDAATGRILKTISMPNRLGQSGDSEWSYIGVCGDVLLGGTGFAHYNKRFRAITWPPAPADLSACNGLAAFDRHTGALLWQTAARHSFFHNGIVAGNGRVYCLDRLPKSAESKIKRRGALPPGDYRIAAFDLQKGRLLWEQTNSISGTWLSYSREHDVVLHAGASATDRLKDEVGQGMMVLRAQDGSVVWSKSDLKYTGPCILYHDLIITTPGSYKLSAGAYRLLDGQPHKIVNPMTGLEQPWRVHRTYGCNTPVASEHLMTFRSGAAGFYDLENHGGTGNLGGFKSGCSANLIIANGVLNAPDYTRTCSCPYQNQTSLGLVHMPEVELWTCNFSGVDAPEGQRIQRVGVNFGAPGDRLAEDGTLWLEFPTNAGISPQLHITATGGARSVFRRHSSAVSGAGPAWVVASGLRGLESITIVPQTLKSSSASAGSSSKDKDDDDEDEDKGEGSGSQTNAATSASDHATARTNGTDAVSETLSSLPPASYTVRLFFLEPDDVQPGQRVFDVLLQGQRILSGFDILKEAKQPNHGLVKEFRNVVIGRHLELRFETATAASLGPILSGVELVQEQETSIRSE